MSDPNRPEPPADQTPPEQVPGQDTHVFPESVATPPAPPQTPPPAPQPAPQPAQAPRYAPYQPAQQAPLTPPPPPPPSPGYPAPGYPGAAQPTPPYAVPPAYGPPLPGPGEPFDGATTPEDLSRPLYGATFGQSITRFFKNYANFSGRASRSEFWWAQLFLALVSLIPFTLLMIGFFAVGATMSSRYDPYLGYSTTEPAAGAIAMLIVCGGLVFLLWAATIVPTLAIGWRRLHDGNFPGPLYLLVLGSMIPFINYIAWLGSIAVLVLTILPSKPEGRRYLSNR